MPGSFGKARGNDFARYANLGGKKVRKKKELDYLVSACGGRCDLMDSEMEKLALLESERLYRVSCVLAYGSNPPEGARRGRKRTHRSMIAAETDVGQFAQVKESGEVSANEAGEEEVWFRCSYEVLLPYDEHLLGAFRSTLRTPSRYHGSLNPVDYHFGDTTQEVINGGRCQRFTLWSYNQDNDPRYAREPFKVLAQAIINARISSNLIGVFDGKPLFETERPIDALWQTLAELTAGQAPGVCPVCGKIIDRRRGKGGGHPPVACKEHINKFHNDLKREVKNSENHDPAKMAYKDECEKAIRGLRWKEKPELNERPLIFPTNRNSTSFSD